MRHHYCTGEAGMPDLLMLASRWLLFDCADVPGCSGADITGDRSVTLSDFTAMASNWMTLN